MSKFFTSDTAKINSEEVKKINLDDLSRLGKLEETYKELFEKTKHKYPVGSDERREIEEQILAIDNRIKEEEQARVGTSSAKPSSTQGSNTANTAGSTADNSTNTQNFNNLLTNCNKILDILEEGKKNGFITSGSDGPNVSSINNKFLSFNDKKTFDSLLKEVDGIYDNLEKMGLDVRKTEKKEGEKSANFYAIRFPEAYEGNRDVMTLTEKEINEIKVHYKNETPEQKQSADSSNYEISALGDGSLIKDKSMSNIFGLKKVDEKSADQDKEEEVGKTAKEKDKAEDWSSKVRTSKGGVSSSAGSSR